jgi:hypothetical protein
MRVHLTSASTSSLPLARAALEKVEECARLDRMGVHQLEADPERADVILFVESDHGIGPFASALRRHPLVRRYRDRCFVYNAADRPVAHLPGLYASIERHRYDPRRVRTSHYLSTHLSVPPLLSRAHEERELLYSFVGDARNAPVRRHLLELQHPRGFCQDVSRLVPSVWGDEASRNRFVLKYAETLANSRFALCPRGVGASSIRLFESMRAGCAPVILSDQWVPPVGPDWSAFAVLVPEAHYAEVPRILEGIEADSARMGALARSAWENWFADEVTFHRLVEWCLEIVNARNGSETMNPARFVTLTERCWPANLRHTVRWLRARYRSQKA